MSALKTSLFFFVQGLRDGGFLPCHSFPGSNFLSFCEQRFSHQSFQPTSKPPRVCSANRHVYHSDQWRQPRDSAKAPRAAPIFESSGMYATAAAPYHPMKKMTMGKKGNPMAAI